MYLINAEALGEGVTQNAYSCILCNEHKKTSKEKKDFQKGEGIFRFLCKKYIDPLVKRLPMARLR